MNKIFILLILVISISACADRKEGEEKTTLLSNFFSLTENEDQGVKEILRLYGGRCEYSVGFSKTQGEDRTKFFELEISQSNAIEKFDSILEMPASNIAYIFYKSLKNEESNYSEIRTNIILSDGSKQTFSFSSYQLETVENKIDLAHLVVSLLKKKNFEQLKSILNDTLIYKYDKVEAISNISKIEANLPSPVELIPYGFRFTKLKDSSEVLHISGIINRVTQSNEFSIDIDPNSNKKEVLLLQYKF